MRSKTIHFHSDVADKSFIPISRIELIKTIIAQSGEGRSNKLPPLIEVLQTIYHARYHRYYLSLKTAYRPFNPDKDIVTKCSWTNDEKQCLQKKFFSKMSALL